MAVIVIDPGHGGSQKIGGSSPNNATSSSGLLEKNLTLAVAKHAAAALAAQGHVVTLTRTKDANLGLTDRAKVAKTAAATVFVSIHFNGFGDPTVQGTETWVHQQASTASRALAAAVQKSVLAQTGYKDRGVQAKQLGVLDPSSHLTTTAGCLAELSFITTSAEDARLKNASYLLALGTGVADGISHYLASLGAAPGVRSRAVASHVAKEKSMAKKAAAKPKALSLHLGLNSVNPKSYEGWSGDLVACEFDAKDMAAVAKGRGFSSTTLLTKSATRAKVLAGLRSAAKKLKAGDFFFLTYSGHGGQVPDVSGEEDDQKDETWCLFDGELIDDELHFELSKFAKGVRVLVLSDSCHSGTVTRAPRTEASALGRSKAMPTSVAMRTYRAHQAFYDKLQQDIVDAVGTRSVADPDEALSHLSNRPGLAQLEANCVASVILISGCQDNQTSMDGDHNGAFTEQLLAVWNDGKFKGDYVTFHRAIRAAMPSSQSPNFFTLGKAGAFGKEAPFTV